MSNLKSNRRVTNKYPSFSMPISSKCLAKYHYLWYYLGGEKMNNLVMAYLGDAVYELHIRKFLISQGISKVGELQKKSVEYVSARSQRRILEELINRNFLTTEEIEIVNRGRNANSHPSKTTDIITYKKATGLECLIGNLYKENIERCNELLNYITGEL